MASSGRIEELKKKFDENPRRYFAPLANEYRKAGDIAQAIAICQEHLPQQPGHMSGHIVYGQALFEAGQFPEAKTVFETALTLDPENLIALRQLGDIARVQGDPGDARRWYERVLEADPRNEEILGLLSTMEGGGGATPTPVVNPVIPAEPAETLLSLSDLETVEIRPVQRPSAAATTGETVVGEQPLETAPPEAELPSFADLIERSGEEPAPVAAEQPADLPVIEMDSAVPGTTRDHEADAGALAGLETSHFEGAAEVGHSAVEGLETGEFLSPGAEAPPTSEDVTSIVPEAAPAEEFERAESPIEEMETAAASSQELELIQPEPDEETSPALELIEPEPAEAEEPEAVAPSPTPEPEPVPEMPPAEAAAPAATPEPVVEEPAVEEPEVEEAPVEEPSVFVTETMAELLVTQGHRTRALEVYAELIAAAPDDAGLRARRDALRDEISRAETPAIAAAAVPSPRKTGPTIRDFLGAIAARRPGERVSSAMETPAIGVEPISTVPPAPHAEEVQAVPVVRPGGTIDALFAHIDAHRDDLAAQRLADAFGAGSHENGASAPPAPQEVAAAAAAPEPEPVRGAPARKASRELSLDEVFHDRSSGATSTAPGFSFDQFFANGASAQGGSAESGSAPANTAAPDDDIKQFTAWLEGLKKS